MTQKNETGELEFTKSTKYALWSIGGILSVFVSFVLALLVSINATTQELSSDIRGQYKIIHEQRYEMHILKVRIEEEVIPTINELRQDLDEMEENK